MDQNLKCFGINVMNFIFTLWEIKICNKKKKNLYKRRMRCRRIAYLALRPTEILCCFVSCKILLESEAREICPWHTFVGKKKTQIKYIVKPGDFDGQWFKADLAAVLRSIHRCQPDLIVFYYSFFPPWR